MSSSGRAVLRGGNRMKLRVAGIRRNACYSPNQVTNDGLILLKTAEELIRLGVDCRLYEEKNIHEAGIHEDVIFTMARGYEALKDLERWEQEGRLIINSPQASLNCYRVNMVERFKKAGFPFPDSKIVTTHAHEHLRVADVGERKVWVKRGDVHAVHREDVCPVYGDEELNFTLKEFARRGIKDAVLQEHIHGDVIKFYAVRGTDFFRWYYHNDNSDYPLDVNRLKGLSQLSAEIMGLHIYGGDAIVSADGNITVIDINDWPSFALFRDEASRYIAISILSAARKFTGMR